MSAIILALFQDVVIPELASWIKTRHAAGAPPTLAEIVAHMNETADATVTAGEAWLKSKGAL